MAKRHSSGKTGEGSSAMDIMTALIGCLILILLGILVIVLVSQVMIMIAEPDNKQVRSIIVSHVDGFRESQAFPEGNTLKEPLYVDVHANKIIVYPFQQEIPQRELFKPGNDFDTLIEIVGSRPNDEYVLFLVRPDAPDLYNALRRKVERYNERITDKTAYVEIGVELYESGRKIDAGMTTRQQEKVRAITPEEFRAKQREAEMNRLHVEQAGVHAPAENAEGGN